VNCPQSGCAGIVEDGYCNVCGMAPKGGPAGGLQTAGTTNPSRTVIVRRAGTSHTRVTSTASRHLGAGLVEIPPVPERDPASAVMVDPHVAESRRFCARCDAPVGRGHAGEAGRTSGFCRRCGAPFSFTPKLAPGDVVAGQYEVVGCLAHGGLGWVYLAKDRNVSDRWVVLKGLLNSDDEAAMTAALAERRFLAEVEHPNIVKIFNFVQHADSGYIVMEYVGGTSLKGLLQERRAANDGNPSPLPVTEAIAYILEILPALEYLHRAGLLFCDFKLDNVIQTQHSLKLIDLGGVYQMAAEADAVFGTIGYQAPEIAEAGPSVSSDLFTVARTLALLCIEFKGYQTTFRYTLPPQDSVPLFIEYDSLYRFLLKGTAPHPDDRFQSAAEMQEQLVGLLREVVAREEGRAVPGASTLFTGDFRARPDSADWRLLPMPLVAADDPAAGYLATLQAADSDSRIAMLRAAPERTDEVDLQLARALIDAGDVAGAEELLGQVEVDDPWEWRVQWNRGVARLARAEPQAAAEQFTRVYRALPGELACKLALGVAFELAGEPNEAAAWYEIVSRTDPGFTTATFGLARCRRALGDTRGAIAAFEWVPSSSISYVDAQKAKIACLITSSNGGNRLAELEAASTTLDALELDPEQKAKFKAELLVAALGLVEANGFDRSSGAQLAGCALAPAAIRAGLERTYRSLARAAATSDQRIELVDQANRVRPRTWT
jgi:serine/threonine-protein kinase PknG